MAKFAGSPHSDVHVAAATYVSFVEALRSEAAALRAERAVVACDGPQCATTDDDERDDDASSTE